MRAGFEADKCRRRVGLLTGVMERGYFCMSLTRCRVPTLSNNFAIFCKYATDPWIRRGRPHAFGQVNSSLHMDWPVNNRRIEF